MSDYNIFEMDNILLMIGEELGEALVNGIRFTREMKIRWLGRAQLQLSIELPDNLLQSFFNISTETLSVDSAEFTIDNEDLDYLVRIDYDVAGGTNYRTADRVSSNEFQLISQAISDDELDTSEDNVYASSDNPIYRIKQQAVVSDGTDPSQRFYILEFYPTPESGISPTLKLTYMNLPNTMNYVTPSWDTTGSIGITIHKACLLALIDLTIAIGKRVDKEFQESNVYEGMAKEKIYDLLQKYNKLISGSKIRQIKTINFFGCI